MKPPQTTALTLGAPPVVAGLPILGSALDLMRKPVQFIVDGASQHGPIFSFRALGTTVTVLSGPEGVALVKDHGSGAMDRKGLFDAFREHCAFDIFEKMGDDHKRMKSLVRAGYSRQILAQFTPEIVEETSRIIDQWQEGDMVSMLDELATMSMRGVRRAVSPEDLSDLENDVVKLGTRVMFVTLKLRPWAHLYHPLHLWRRRRVWKRLDETIARHKDKDLGQGDDDERLSMIDAFLIARSKDGHQLSPRDVRGAVIYALAGTHIYVGRVLAFMLYEILKNPALHERVQAEADAAFDGGPLDPAIFRRMSHLRATYQEAMRVYPLLAGLPFRAARDLNVGGYQIPEGRILVISPLPGHFLSAAYEGPQNFDAARWTPDRKEHRCPGGWAPYGIGPRMCVAAGIVEVLCTAIIATLLHRRELSLRSPSYSPTVRMTPLIAPTDHLPVVIGRARTDADRTATKDLLLDRAIDTAGLEEDWQSLTLPELTPEIFQPGEDVVSEGDPALHFYIILSGEALVLKDGELLRRLGATESFGERGLLKGVPRSATVRAETELRVLSLDRDTFLTLAANADLMGADLGLAIQRRFVRATVASALPKLDMEQLGKASEDFDLRLVSAGDIVFAQGDAPDGVYLICDGEVEIRQVDPSGTDHHLRNMGTGEYFGEIGVLQQHARTSSVIANTDVVLLVLTRENFVDLLGESPESAFDVVHVMGARLMRSLEMLGGTES